MRLAACVPSIPTHLVTCLEKIGIRTDTDLLFSETLDVFRRLPPETTTLPALTQCIETVAEIASAPGISASDMLKMEQEVQANSPSFPSGVPKLDEIVGMFRGRQVFEISGDKQSGKTALILHVILRHLVEHNRSNALWVDTTGEFSVSRAIEVLSLYESETTSTVLERLQVSLVFDIDAVHQSLDEAISTIDSDASRGGRLRCIVIDAITPLLGPLLSAISPQGHAIMTSFMRQLRELAQRYSLSIFVINNSTSSQPSNPFSVFEGTARKPALGPSFTYMSDMTLWLSKTDENDEVHGVSVHVAEICRSKYMNVVYIQDISGEDRLLIDLHFIDVPSNHHQVILTSQINHSLLHFRLRKVTSSQAYAVPWIRSLQPLISLPSLQLVSFTEKTAPGLSTFSGMPLETSRDLPRIYHL